jgi:TonB family protein
MTDMKGKRLLMITMFSLAAVGLAQQTDQPGVQRVQRPEAIAMGNLTYVVDPTLPGDPGTVTGKVVLRILIDKEGKVAEANLVSGHPILVSSCLDAVRQWKFRPYVLNNVPVEAETTATIEFIADPPHVVTPKPIKLRVSQGVLHGNLIRTIEPTYPAEAKVNHIQGEVVLLTTIGKDGNVAYLKLVQGYPLLAEAAMKAVPQWKYRPFLLNGEPVEIETTIETTIKIQFHM